MAADEVLGHQFREGTEEKYRRRRFHGGYWGAYLMPTIGFHCDLPATPPGVDAGSGGSAVSGGDAGGGGGDGGGGGSV